MSTVQELLAKRKPHTDTARLLLDGELAAEVARARRDLDVAITAEKANTQGLASPIPQLQQRLAELTIKADEAATVFTFQALGRRAFEDLKLAYPPTEEQWERYRERVTAAYWVPAPEFEEVTFAPALIAACCIDPKMTLAEAQQLWDELSDGEAAILYAKALEVNEEASSRPFSGTGTDTTRNSGPDSTTPQNGEYPSLSSAAGS